MALAALVAVAFIAPLASAWGPVSHQLFACALVAPADCVSADGSFVLGAFSPDAFKTDHRQMHDFGYASAQVEYARSLPQPASPSHFNATAFSLGFVAHLLQDHVGHHANGYEDADGILSSFTL
jgi:hypothetical protein